MRTGGEKTPGYPIVFPKVVFMGNLPKHYIGQNKHTTDPDIRHLLHRGNFLLYPNLEAVPPSLDTKHNLGPTLQGYPTGIYASDHPDTIHK
jgi:hypothetical protein